MGENQNTRSDPITLNLSLATTKFLYKVAQRLNDYHGTASTKEAAFKSYRAIISLTGDYDGTQFSEPRGLEVTKENLGIIESLRNALLRRENGVIGHAMTLTPDSFTAKLSMRNSAAKDFIPALEATLQNHGISIPKPPPARGGRAVADE